jgi:DNA-binding HxlR family transcriptional regulator
VIADRLRQLEGCGLVELDASLIAVEYVITPFGATALDCLDHLRIWVEGLLEELQNS